MKKVQYSKELLEAKIQNCYSFAELARRLGLSDKGSNCRITIKKKLDEFQIDYSHFTGQIWNRPGHPNYGNSGEPVENILVKEGKQRSANLRKRLINLGLKENKCECCGLSEWQGKPITIQLHHINGDHHDNRIENLQMLCPNCHSQTNTFCKRKEIRE